MAEHSSLGQIGRYQLLRRIGIGGMGEVFLARSSGVAGFETEVCIKRILPHLAGQADFVRRFVEEGKLVSRLRHAGIAQVLDLGDDVGGAYLAMEYVDGADLRALMRRARRAPSKLPTADLLDELADSAILAWILLQVLDALEYAHSQGVIHRDISPSNIMVARTGHVKLVDFGLARAADRLSLSATGAIQGKFSYMSPEQAAGRELDARSDLFSLGVTAWELFCGERPFDGATDLQTLDRVRGLDPGPVAVSCPEVPDGVAAVIDRLLHKDPADRYASAGAARQELASYLATAGVPVGPPEVAAWMNKVMGGAPETAALGHAGQSFDGALDVVLAAAGGSGVGGEHTRTAAAPPESAEASVPATLPPATEPSPAPLHRVVAVVETPSPSATSTPSAVSTPSVTSTPSVLATRTSRWAVAMLVVFNLLLLGAVGLLLYELAQDDEARPRTVAGEGTGPLPAMSGVSGVPIGPSVAARSLAPDTANHSNARDTDGTPRETPASTPPTSDGGSAPPVDGAGDVDGAALGPDADASDTDWEPDGTVEEVASEDGRVAVEAAADTKRRKLTVSAEPASATVTVRGYGSVPAGRPLSIRGNAWVRVSVQAPGYRTERFRVRLDRDRVRHIRLVATKTGTVMFRFFPASATVAIDGRVVVTKTNVVKRSLAPGKHRLRLKTDGGGRTLTFDVKADETTNLGTVRTN